MGCPTGRAAQGLNRPQSHRAASLKRRGTALVADEPRHGYELIKAIEELTEGAYAPSPGTIYPTLSLLEDEGATVEFARQLEMRPRSPCGGHAARRNTAAGPPRTRRETAQRPARRGRPREYESLRRA